MWIRSNDVTKHKPTLLTNTLPSPTKPFRCVSLSRTPSTLIHIFLWCLPCDKLQVQTRLLPLNSRMLKLQYSTWILFISQNQTVLWSIKMKRQRMKQRIHPCSINQKRQGDFGVLLMSSKLMFTKGCLQSMSSVSLQHCVHERLSAVTELRVSQTSCSWTIVSSHWTLYLSNLVFMKGCLQSQKSVSEVLELNNSPLCYQDYHHVKTSQNYSPTQKTRNVGCVLEFHLESFHWSQRENLEVTLLKGEKKEGWVQLWVVLVGEVGTTECEERSLVGRCSWCWQDLHLPPADVWGDRSLHMTSY